jgi:exopolysaccharide biosynthesis polyprenyl glycosylphosphotransferase
MQVAAQHDTVAALPRPAARGGYLGRGRTSFLGAGDVLALTLAYATTYVLSDHIGSLPPVSAPAWLLALLAVVAVPGWLAVFTAYGLYGRDSLRLSVASFDEIGSVFHALLVGSLAVLVLDQGVRRLAGWWVSSALEATIFLLAASILVPVVRGTIRSWVFPRVMRPRRALVIGSGLAAKRVERKLRVHPENGLEVAGVVEADRDDLAQLVDELEIERVVIASPVGGHEETLELLREVRRPYVFVSIVPSYADVFTSSAILDELEGMPVVSLPPLNLSRASRLLKRSFDLAATSIVLVLIAPLLALVALAIRLDSRGPALFRQPRRGRGGSTFEIVKFRTMRVGAEDERHDVAQLNEVDGPLFKVKQGRDPRVTRIGAFLRRTSLDELPQLWNVLRGEMSLVGPRPFVVYEADQITGWASKRLETTPGITGLWQVLGRNDMPFDEMVKLDYLYVTNWSLWWDLKILCQTIPVVLGRRGAY